MCYLGLFTRESVKLAEACDTLMKMKASPTTTALVEKLMHYGCKTECLSQMTLVHCATSAVSASECNIWDSTISKILLKNTNFSSI